MTYVHPTAVVEKGAEIGSNVLIGPYTVVGANCIIEDDVQIKGHVFLEGNVVVGKGTSIWPGAVIGTKTQDLKYRGETTYVNIGKGCQIREYVTINSSCKEGTAVTIGDNCLLMAYCHIAHNCELGDRVIMSNNATLAGHVTIERCAVIGGLTAVHQYCRIGCYAMVGGMSRVNYDIPPYTIGAGSPYRFGGLNLVGLKRHGFSLEIRKLLSQAFRYTFRSGLSIEEGLKLVEKEVEPVVEVAHWIEFCRNTKRGLIGSHGIKTKACSKSIEPIEGVIQQTVSV